MNLEFARATPADMADLDKVQSWVYNGRAPGEPNPEPRGNPAYLVRSEGRPLAAADLIEYEFLVRGVPMKAGGVGGVATLVEARRSGAASRLMEGMIREMREDSRLLACLYAYRETYYRRFGYEQCGWRWLINCPTHRLPKTALDLPVRQVDPQEAPAVLDACYREFISRQSGACLRTPQQWLDRLGRTPGAIYTVGDPVEGYFWGDLSGFWVDTTLGEFAWTTPRAYAALMAVLGGACANKNSVSWCEPPRSAALAHFSDQGIEAKRNRATMYRVVNVPAALAALAPPAAPYTLEVLDPLVPENQGPWQVGPGGVERADSAGIRLTIQSFSQAFMGDPSLADLAALGAVEILDPQSLHNATQHLGPESVVCMEFF